MTRLCKRSKAWRYFQDEGNVARCKTCGKTLTAKNSTSHLLRHIRIHFDQSAKSAQYTSAEVSSTGKGNNSRKDDESTPQRSDNPKPASSVRVDSLSYLSEALDGDCSIQSPTLKGVATPDLRASLNSQELSTSKEAAAINELLLITELATVSKLVELYKESSGEWSKKAGELEGVIKALETHLTQVEDEYKEKLEKEVSVRIKLEKEAAEMREQLEKREMEIENVRRSSELTLLPMTSPQLDSTMQELVLSDGAIHRADGDVQMIVPKAPPSISGTALAASFLREGWTLAKMYEQYQDAADALRHERWGRRHAEAELEMILHEIEQKAELILDERAEHERLVEAYSLLNQKLKQSLLEHENFENTIRSLKSELRRRDCDNIVAQKEINDLTKQVSVLLKECQDIQIRHGGTGLSASLIAVEDNIHVSDPSGQRTFRDINGIVEQNVELQSQVQRLSAELEKVDEELKEHYQNELKKRTNETASKVDAVFKRSEEQQCLIDSLHTSMALYKRLYEEERKNRSSSVPKGLPEEGTGDIVLQIENSQPGVSMNERTQLMERARKLEDLTVLKSETLALRLDRVKMTPEANFSKERLNSSLMELEHQIDDDIWKMKEELEKLREDAQANKKYMLQYKEIAQTNEAKLKQIESVHEEYKAESERSKLSLEGEVTSLRSKLSELEKIYNLRCQEAASAIEEKDEQLFSLVLEISVLKDEMTEKMAQMETLQTHVSSLKDEFDREHKRWRIAQDNYEREENLKASWEHEKQELQKERDETLRKYNETDEQNKLLHSKLESLHIRLADKEQASAGYSVDSESESDLQNVLSYLRRSKEKLDIAFGASQDAQALLRSQAENAKTTMLKDEEFKSLQLLMALADKQVALEKLEWEGKISSIEVEELQGDVAHMSDEISILKEIFEKLSPKNNSVVCLDDEIALECEPIEFVDDIGEIDMDKMEQEIAAYMSALAAAKENPDEKLLDTVAQQRLRIQELLYS